MTFGTKEWNAELVWLLQLLSQDFETQCDVYDASPCIADDLVLDFELIFARFTQAAREVSPDLVVLHDLFRRKSGQLEYWTVAAMERSPFWDDIRAAARQVLVNRGMSTKAPIPLKVTSYIVPDKRAIGARLAAIFRKSRSFGPLLSFRVGQRPPR